MLLVSNQVTRELLSCITIFIYIQFVVCRRRRRRSRRTTRRI